MRVKILIVLTSIILCTSCKEDALPKPKAMLRLDFPRATYDNFESENFIFEINENAKIKVKDDNALIIDYPSTIKGSIYITYKKVEDDFNKLVSNTKKLSYEHASRADNIMEQPFVNPEGNVYGIFFEIMGNAASQAQFYVTDSTNHFVSGSVYFYAKPNYDSIYPAANYLQKDIRRIMESMEWK